MVDDATANIVKTYYQSYPVRDREAIETVVADDRRRDHTHTYNTGD